VFWGARTSATSMVAISGVGRPRRPIARRAGVARRTRRLVRTSHGPPGRPRPADDAEPPLAVGSRR
jgi:hypothetical protein